MMGKPQQLTPKLFYVGVNIEERIPANNRYRRLAQCIRFDQVRGLVKDCYGDRGNESLDPVVILKLMLILFIEQVRSERELMNHLPLRLDWLWFCQMDLDTPIPDHSVLSKARARWGVEVFDQLFARVLEACEVAGLIEGRTVYADSTVLKANADVHSRISRQLWNQLEEARLREEQAGQEPLPLTGSVDGSIPASQADSLMAPPEPPARPAVGESVPPPTPDRPKDPQAALLPSPPTGKFNARWVSKTDPDAATTFRRGKGVTLGYRDHTLVDGRCGIILATVATRADYDDADLLPVLLDQAERYIEVRPREAVADSQYGSRKNQLRMHRRKIDSYLKRRAGHGADKGKSWIQLLDPELDRGRAIRLMKRRLHLSEGRFAMAHARMGHRRCRWRGRQRVQIQCYLVAMGQNLDKLSRHRKPAPRKLIAARIPVSSPIILAISHPNPNPRPSRILHAHHNPF